MCDYCETAYYKNDSGREFGKLFDKTLDYTGEIQLSWIKESGMKTGYELYMNDNEPALIYQCQLIFAQSADEALIHTINIPQVDPAERYGFRRIGLGD